MKKFFISLVLCVVLIPMTIKATTISGVDISSNISEVEIGKSITLTFKVNISDRSDLNKTGILLGLLSIDFDPNVFLISKITPSYGTYLYYEESGIVLVGSGIDVDSISGSEFLQKGLFQNYFTIDVTFFVQSTDLTSSNISVTSETMGLFTITDESKIYDENDLEISTKSLQKSHTVKIKQNESAVVTPPQESITEKSPGTLNPIKPPVTETSSSPTQSNVKSSNAYLKSLTVEGYDIDFKLSKLKYIITVNEDVNSLNISAQPDSSKATYKIIGADDLKANNYEVTVEVTAENGAIKTYTINVKTNRALEIEDIKNTPSEEPRKKLDKKTIIYGSIALGALILLLLIIFIIHKVKDRKMDKLLNNL